jgi:hypothetical protein
MTVEDEKLQEMQVQRDLFAGIALPGLIPTMTIYDTYGKLAEKAYKIAEAMVEESERLKQLDTEEPC